MNKVKNEVWKTYPEFPFVEVSTFGRVRTLNRVVTREKGMYVVKGRVLKQHPIIGGYLQVTFSVNGKTVTRYVHRLVAQTFLPNPDDLPEVNHKDNNPSNNNVSNLEWCTGEYNIAYREKYGKSSAEVSGCPVYAVNLKTAEVSCFKSQSDAGRLLGVKQQSISSVIKGKRKTAGGYWFTNDNEHAIEYVRAKFGDIVAYKVKKLMVGDGKVEKQWLHNFVNEM